MSELILFGEMIPEWSLDDSFSFEILDIDVRGKLLRKDSFAASKIYSNMEFLGSAKHMVLSASNSADSKALKDAVGAKKTFRLKISAYLGSYGLKMYLYDCKMIDSMIATFDVKYQVYEIKFDDFYIQQISSSPRRQIHRRSPISVVVPDPWSPFGI